MAINVEMPFYKAQQQMAAYRNNMPLNLPIKEVDNVPPDSPNIFVDGVSFGVSGDASQQRPLVRHVLVKDLNKIMARMKLERPKLGVFSNKAPMGLYALFDGLSTAGTPGPLAAEFCARNFHSKLVQRLATLEGSSGDKAHVEGCLRDAFKDLDEELLAGQPDIHDGCGAAVALVIGDFLFTALLGRCRAVLCQVQDGEADLSRYVPLPLGGGQGQVDADLQRIGEQGFAGASTLGVGADARLRHPTGAVSSVTRSLGDRWWKGTAGGSVGPAVLMCTPEVQSLTLMGHEVQPFVLLTSSAVSASVSPKDLVETASSFQLQPRAVCARIVRLASEIQAGNGVQCTAVQLCFLPPRDKKKLEGEPAAKKAKTDKALGGTQSVRLRHILIRFNDGSKESNAKGPAKKVTRTRVEAEDVALKVIAALWKQIRDLKKPPKDATEAVQFISKKFVELAREFSDCETSKKAGTMCGDLGWVTMEMRKNMGTSFAEVIDRLSPGQLGDIAVSSEGLHVVQRVA
eukprot:TRINITY_DN36401_c0_g1_i1.p1 TRINITY_DN36401_c0_g1~~TRINITY_DN36401_c0_g1_i1.p1  ORF type:complete len:516 (+),score=131.54 TRINITY_DN36401_c0_g1_i1:168-1715(+)